MQENHFHFDSVKHFFLKSCLKLQIIKKHLQAKKKVADDLLVWQSEVLNFKANLNSASHKKHVKLIHDLIEKSTKRELQSKIPSSINYLEVKELADHDIDWIVKNQKAQWARFCQIYWTDWLNSQLK